MAVYQNYKRISKRFSKKRLRNNAGLRAGTMTLSLWRNPRRLHSENSPLYRANHLKLKPPALEKTLQLSLRGILRAHNQQAR